MTNDLTGSTALVTGGNSGIGRATAVALAQLGAHVVVSGRDASRGDPLVEHCMLDPSHRLLFRNASVSDAIEMPLQQLLLLLRS